MVVMVITSRKLLPIPNVLFLFCEQPAAVDVILPFLDRDIPKYLFAIYLADIHHHDASLHIYIPSQLKGHPPQNVIIETILSPCGYVQLAASFVEL